MGAAYWTDERTATLTRLWAEGLSASQIAARLGGITRSGVIGKVHRLGVAERSLSPRPAPRRARPAALQPVQKKPAPKPVVNADLKPAPSLGLTILEVGFRQCRFATHEDGGEHRFCGHETVAGSSYCAAHKAVIVSRERTDAARRKKKRRTDADIQLLRQAQRESGLTRVFG